MHAITDMSILDRSTGTHSRNKDLLKLKQKVTCVEKQEEG